MNVLEEYEYVSHKEHTLINAATSGIDTAEVILVCN